MLTKRHFLMAGGAIALLPSMARADAVLRIPLQFFRDIHPVVQVTLDGKGPYAFLVTTGASSDVIDADLAAELGLKPVNGVANFLLNNQVISAGEVAHEHQVEAGSVVVGGVYTVGRCVFDTSDDNDETGVRKAQRAKDMALPNYPRGILGTRFLEYAPTVFDNERNEIRVYPDGLSDTGGYEDLKADVSGLGQNGSIVIEVKAQLGGDTLPCWIDLNGSAELYLSSKYVRRHGLWTKFADFKDYPFDLLDPGKGTMRAVRMKDFVLGPLHFDEINVILGDPEHDDRLNEAGVKAVIGRGLLKQANIAFDGARILMKANSAFTPVSGPYVREPID